MSNDRKLVIGGVYFFLSFLDKQGRCPQIQTLIYIGKNLDNERAQEDRWYFQDPSSYLKRGSVADLLDPERGRTVDEQSDAYRASKSAGHLEPQVTDFGARALFDILTADEMIEKLASISERLAGPLRP